MEARGDHGPGGRQDDPRSRPRSRSSPASWSRSSARAGRARARCSRCWPASTAPSGGRVTVNGEPLATRLTDVGYVPQDDIVHPLLGRERGAQLRGPAAASPGRRAARDRRGDRRACWSELALEEHAETRVGSLSGGQRRRTERGRRAARQARAALPRRAHHRHGPGARDEDDGAVPRARGRIARRGAGHPRDQEPRAVRPRGRDGARRAPGVRRPAGGRARLLRCGRLRRHLHRPGRGARRSAGRPRRADDEQAPKAAAGERRRAGARQHDHPDQRPRRAAT